MSALLSSGDRGADMRKLGSGQRADTEEPAYVSAGYRLPTADATRLPAGPSTTTVVPIFTRL